MSDFATAKIKLDYLLNTDPSAAIEFVNGLPDDINMTQLKAGAFIDAGFQIKSESYISQGIALFENLFHACPKSTHFAYNLANGLNNLCILKYKKHTIPCSWSIETIRERLLAKNLYSITIAHSNSEVLITQSYNNRANMLYQGSRWVEAMREYQKALAHDPNNGVAIGGVIKQIVEFHKRYGFQKVWLELLIPPLYKSILKNEKHTISLCGKFEYDKLIIQLRDLGIPDIKPTAMKQKRGKLSPYDKFILTNHLYLNPVMCRELFASDKCDSLRIISLLETKNSRQRNKGNEFRVPNIFTMFNIIKSDFLATRWLAFSYFTASIPKNSYYHDTLDYAVYGTKPALLTLTQKLAFDILDKIAVAILTLFNDKNAERASFKDAWFKIDRQTQSCELNPLLQDSIHKGNKALLALCELAFDLYDYYQQGCSYLKKKHRLRNASTHRFSVLHDMSNGSDRKDGPIEHYGLSEVENELLDTLFMVKAAILYFVEAIYYQNGISCQASKGRFVEIGLPTHKDIRGTRS